MSQIILDPDTGVPLYRQLADSIRGHIKNGSLQDGERLPATRELALQLGLNRATVSAAYNLLEASGALRGHVGRGSFVALGVSANPDVRSAPRGAGVMDWDSILPPLEFSALGLSEGIRINLASSRPSADQFPLAAFQRVAKEVVESAEATQILQLGSPHGYAPLRRYLVDKARTVGVAKPADDLLMTNGCQQALDLIARMFPVSERVVALENPVYHGIMRVFQRADANIVWIPVDHAGLDVDAFEVALARSMPKLVVVTPSFQNPMGTTLTLERRKRLLQITQRAGIIVVENDIYSELRYVGQPLPTLKELDTCGNVILLRSYSKVSFPGLRVGWVMGARPFIARLAENKQISDLHSDQLSQAVLLRFAEAGELAAHLSSTLELGRRRLNAAMEACHKYLPAGSSFTRPEGGMCFWVDLPAPLNAESVLAKAEKRGVSYLPGSLFSNRPAHRRGLRISFGGLTPQEIADGIRLIAEAATEEIKALAAHARQEPSAAIV